VGGVRIDRTDPESGEVVAETALTTADVSTTSPAPGASPDEQGAAAARPVAAFFDVDNTIIRGASSFYLARALWRRGFFRKRDIVNFAFQQARYLAFGETNQQIDEVRSRALFLMTGHSVAEVVAIGEEVYDQVLSQRIFPGTQKLLDAHQAAGHQVWLVTATPVEIGDLIARRLGATGALGTVAEHSNGFYTGRLVGDMMHGTAKANAVQVLAADLDIDLEASSAYGDSMNDVPLLSTVGNPCAINPDPRLRKHSKTIGWPIREFRGKRRAAKRGMKTASWAGLAWAAGLVVRSATRAVRGRLGH
jgi:HAD superfamily hydrolase (TIGR01490 family)